MLKIKIRTYKKTQIKNRVDIRNAQNIYRVKTLDSNVFIINKFEGTIFKLNSLTC